MRKSKRTRGRQHRQNASFDTKMSSSDLNVIKSTFIVCIVISVSMALVYIQIGGNSNSNSNSDSSKSKFENNNYSHQIDQRQKVVFLAGPHKTSSSSIQLNLSTWLKNKEKDISGLSAKWAWPSPSAMYRENGCEVNEEKIFYPWVEVLKGQTKKGRCITESLSGEEILESYRNEISSQWRLGYNLVIGSEALDFANSQRRRNPTDLIDRVMEQLPWHGDDADASTVIGSDADVTVVVKFRAPRSSHLISLWHQCCMKTMSFHEYLTDSKLEIAPDPLRSLDSLRLAQIFLEKNLNVILVDMSGVSAQGYDMSKVIACDVLGAECTQDKQFPGAVEEKAKIANVRTHSDDNFNITQAQLDRMDDAIEEYDCNFVSLIDHPKLEVLYAAGLHDILENCKEHKGKPLMSRKDLVERISLIARDEDDPTDDDLANDDYDGNDDDYYSNMEKDWS